jgi:hypothetical protein
VANDANINRAGALKLEVVANPRVDRDAIKDRNEKVVAEKLKVESGRYRTWPWIPKRKPWIPYASRPPRTSDAMKARLKARAAAAS